MVSIDIYKKSPETLGPFEQAGRDLNAAGWRDEPVFAGDPDLRLVIATRDDLPLGRLSAFINPLLDTPAIGMIGWYECADDPEASAVLLQTGMELLAERGCARVIGPINGDTWHRYRVALASQEPPFFLDMQNPRWYAGQWRDAGFAVVAEYHSAEILVAAVDTDRIERESASYRERGIVIRPIDMGRIDEDLSTIHDIAVRSFDRNFLYTPISLDAFLGLYRPVLPMVEPELVELAFDAAGEPLAFCFALPDLTAPPGSRVIAKTAGRIRRDDTRGLGSHMIERVHLNARRRGSSAVVHALMHGANRSREVLGDIARPIRRYELYGRTL